MSATILDGKDLAKRLRKSLTTEAEALKAKGVTPRIVSIQVEGDDASAWYVKNQAKQAEKCGIDYQLVALPSTVSAEELTKVIATHNADASTHGIILQVPLPEGLDGDAFQQQIHPDKDIEGVTTANLGRLVRGSDDLVPCTARAAVELVVDAEIPIQGKHCVVLGRSVIVGKPLALMMLARHAHVTICHSRTPNLAEVCRSADILMSAVGRTTGMVNADFVKPGATVVDIAIISKEDGGITGDVDAESVEPVAGHFAPVPGGVGPVTVCMLIRNTLIAARNTLSE